MIKDWNREKIEQEIWKIKWAATDPRMDGFVTWGCKQDLILLKYYIEDMLDQCSTYAVEQEFIDKLEADRTFTRLKQK
jgi:DNA-binding transcriptional regulator YbjK